MLRGTIQLDISNASKEAPVESELLDIGGYQWQLFCPSRSSPDRFTVVCNENVDGELWLCKVNCKVETKEGDSDWKKLTEWSDYWFNSYGSAVRRFKGNGLGSANSIKVNIEVKWSAPQCSLHPVDATLKMNFGGEYALVPINKYVLAGNSDYFRNFFFGDGELEAVSKRNDANGNPIYDIQEDQDFNSFQFRFMVHSFLCMGSKLDKLEGKINWAIEDKEKKIALLKLAVKYQLQMFVDFAEKQLIEYGPGTMELLALADQFTLAGLKNHCLETINFIDYGKQFGKNKLIYAKLSPATQELLDAKLEENAHKLG